MMSQNYLLLVIFLITFCGVSSFNGYGIIKLRANSTELMEQLKHFLSLLPNVGEETEFMDSNGNCIIKVPFVQQQEVEEGLQQMGISVQRLVSVTKVEKPFSSTGLTGREKKQPEGSATYDEFPIFNRVVYKLITYDEGAIVVPDLCHKWVKGCNGGITFRKWEKKYFHDFYFELISKQEVRCKRHIYGSDICIKVRAWLKPVRKINDYGVVFLQDGSKYNAYFSKSQSETVSIESKKYGLRVGWVIGGGNVPFGKVRFSNSNLQVKILKVTSTAETISIKHKTTFTNQISATPKALIKTRFNGIEINELLKSQRSGLKEHVQFDRMSELFTNASYDDSEIFFNENTLIEAKGNSKCTLLEGVVSYTYNAGINITISLVYGEISFLNEENKIERRPLNLDKVLLSRGLDENRKIYKLSDPNTYTIEYRKPNIGGLILPYRAFDCSPDTTVEYPLCKQVPRDR